LTQFYIRVEPDANGVYYQKIFQTKGLLATIIIDGCVWEFGQKYIRN
jgi:putative transposase